MISGFSNERVSYRTRYLNFPSTLTESVPSISKPTVHVIKIRFNNVFKNEKVLFGFISVALSSVLLLSGYGIYSAINNVGVENSISATGEEIQNTVAMDQLNAISAEDAGITVMEKSGMQGGFSGSQQGGNYMAYNNGGGIDPNSMLIASGNKSDNGKEVLTSKKAVVNIDDKIAVNPFLPASEVSVKKKVVKQNPNYILPPDQVKENSDASLLMKTMVSGIMYDPFSPSAIIKINDVDYFVKKGDTINGFTILGISDKIVTIKRGANVYRATVGRILATLNMNNNTGTDHINNRFGGSGGVDARNISYKKRR